MKACRGTAFAVAALLPALPLAADAAIYRCPSPGNPHEQIVTNLLSEADAKQRDCVLLNQRASTLDTPPALARRAPAAAPAPATPRHMSTEAQPERKVAPRIQRLRDDERRLILESELRKERETLAQVRQRGQALGADATARREWEQTVARHMSDITAIEREIARLP